MQNDSLLVFLGGKTPESGIPPSYRATRRYTKVHLGFCLPFFTLIGQIGRVPLFGAGPRRYIRSRLFGMAVTAFWRALYRFLAATRQAKADLSSGHSHDRTAFELFAPGISEQPDPNLTDLFDTRNHGSQRLSTIYQHTRHEDARTHIQRETAYRQWSLLPRGPPEGTVDILD